ncbi:uncharacterized protein PG998_012939 [Apiospora kogelbergensis]|uniref:uncharacterized protein n=1 Tax=Apiospora kogelbergensis TaxID=1337665 RepID=UPI00312DC78D
MSPSPSRSRNHRLKLRPLAGGQLSLKQTGRGDYLSLCNHCAVIRLPLGPTATADAPIRSQRRALYLVVGVDVPGHTAVDGPAVPAAMISPVDQVGRGSGVIHQKSVCPVSMGLTRREALRNNGKRFHIDLVVRDAGGAVDDEDLGARDADVGRVAVAAVGPAVAGDDEALQREARRVRGHVDGVVVARDGHVARVAVRRPREHGQGCPAEALGVALAADGVAGAARAEGDAQRLEAHLGRGRGGRVGRQLGLHVAGVQLVRQGHVQGHGLGRYGLDLARLEDGVLGLSYGQCPFGFSWLGCVTYGKPVFVFAQVSHPVRVHPLLRHGSLDVHRLSDFQAGSALHRDFVRAHRDIAVGDVHRGLDLRVFDLDTHGEGDFGAIFELDLGLARAVPAQARSGWNGHAGRELVLARLEMQHAAARGRDLVQGVLDPLGLVPARGAERRRCGAVSGGQRVVRRMVAAEAEVGELVALLCMKLSVIDIDGQCKRQYHGDGDELREQHDLDSHNGFLNGNVDGPVSLILNCGQRGAWGHL